MKIRKATKKDFGQYSRLKKEDIAEYSKIIKQKIKVAQDTQIKKEFDGILKSKDHLILVAETNKELIGYLTGSITKNIWQHSGYIDDVFVIKDFKRKGIATKLMKTFMKIIKTKKIKKCRLGVNTKNKKAIKLYKKLGFKIVHYEMDLKI